MVPAMSQTQARSSRLSIRVDLAAGARIGPGKVALLEAIARDGSISAGGRALRMSYRRAWELIEDLNRSVGVKLVAAAAGGTGGGGARLTEAGRELVAQYRALEQAAAAAGHDHLRRLEALSEVAADDAGA